MKTYNIVSIDEFKTNIENNSRLLGIDPGNKNIGFAICDENKKVATPLKILQKIKFTNNRPVSMRIRTVSSKSGTATYQIGMCPVYPMIPTAVPKPWLLSQVEIHAHASLDHAFPIWRDSDNDQRLDDSGCSPSGCNSALDEMGSV